ncbi:hypothetical protein [Vibrio breoganii]|uniref:hypothetical protein n=1 Tax=Vibrio breoganii TaxID=553239 RepID=UPI0002EA24AD|nr:hypothetical protein [Vibrio breoganii]OED90096.1 hypothetical protein A1QE_17435 [Vibrio breoganii ZF-55]
MKPFHIDPAVIESQIGEKLNAVRVLGLDSTEVLDDLMGHLNQHFQAWLFEYLGELHERAEAGVTFEQKSPLISENASKSKVQIKATRKR